MKPAGRVRRKRRSRKLLGLLITVLLLLLLAGALAVMQLRTVRSIMVVGRRNIGEDQIIEWSGIVLGMRMYEISDRDIRKRLDDQFVVEYVRKEFSYKGELTLYVHERKGLAKVSQGGRYYVIDSEGMVLRRFAADDDGARRTERLPTVIGLEPRGSFHSEIVEGNTWPAEKPEKLATLKIILEALDDVNLIAQLQTVSLEDPDNLYIMMANGMRIELGNSDEALLKLLIACAVMEQTAVPDDPTGWMIDVGTGRKANLVPAVHATRTPPPTPTPAPTATPKPTRTPK